MSSIQIIFDYNTSSPRYGEALMAFKMAVNGIGGKVFDYGMGVVGVDPTLTVKDVDLEQLHGHLLTEGYSFTFTCADDEGNIGPVMVMPPCRLDNQSHVVSFAPRSSRAPMHGHL